MGVGSHRQDGCFQVQLDQGAGLGRPLGGTHTLALGQSMTLFTLGLCKISLGTSESFVYAISIHPSIPLTSLDLPRIGRYAPLSLSLNLVTVKIYQKYHRSLPPFQLQCCIFTILLSNCFRGSKSIFGVGNRGKLVSLFSHSEGIFNKRNGNGGERS